jgi:FlaA1/EpsC-like NDP-sugar epimerase
MILFSHKYRRRREAFLPGWLVLIGILAQAGINMAASIMRASTAALVDLLVINGVLWAGITLRFGLADRSPPYAAGPSMLALMGGLHALLSVTMLVTFWYRGVYSRARYSWRNVLASALFASAILMAAVYFVQQLAFSRIAFAASLLAIAVVLPTWRALAGRIRHVVYATGTVVVLGSGEVARRLIMSVEKDRSARIAGVVWPGEEAAPAEVLGYPVLGMMKHMRAILEVHRADVLLIATPLPWYSDVIEGLASRRVRHLSIRWVPREILARPSSDLPEVIPLHDFTV